MDIRLVPPTHRKSQATQRRRSALREPLGTLRSAGDPDAAAILHEAFMASRAPPDVLTHGFHSYPARLHWAIARTVLAAHGKRGLRVLDPFSGSGTVPIEAMCAGAEAVGSDLNPLSVLLGEVKSALPGPQARQRFVETLRTVGLRSSERVQARVRVRAALSPEEARWYAPHTLLELAGLLEEIRDVSEPRDRRALELIFSAIVVKFAQQASDSTEAPQAKRLRKGLVTEFFLRKGKELVARWEALVGAVPNSTVSPRWLLSDVRKLPRTLAPVDLVLTSPPYGGTYDYVRHHARRFAWFGIDPREFVNGELGARRHQLQEKAAEQWDRDVQAMLSAFKKVLSSSGQVVLLLGDAQLGRRRIDARAQLARLAPTAGFSLQASVTRQRPREEKAANQEHLLLLVPSD